MSASWPQSLLISSAGTEWPCSCILSSLFNATTLSKLSVRTATSFTFDRPSLHVSPILEWNQSRRSQGKWYIQTMFDADSQLLPEFWGESTPSSCEMYFVSRARTMVLVELLFAFLVYRLWSFVQLSLNLGPRDLPWTLIAATVVCRIKRSITRRPGTGKIYSFRTLSKGSSPTEPCIFPVSL